MCSRSLDSILKPYETCLSEEGLRRGKVEGDTGKKKKKKKEEKKKEKSRERENCGLGVLHERRIQV